MPVFTHSGAKSCNCIIADLMGASPVEYQGVCRPGRGVGSDHGHIVFDFQGVLQRVGEQRAGRHVLPHPLKDSGMCRVHADVQFDEKTSAAGSQGLCFCFSMAASAVREVMGSPAASPYRTVNRFTASYSPTSPYRRFRQLSDPVPKNDSDSFFKIWYYYFSQLRLH